MSGGGAASGNVQRFVAEAREHLALMTTALMALERGGEDHRPHIEALLRSAHSIKGGAGITGHRTIEQLAHAMETAVERLRDGDVKTTPEAIDALLFVLDRIMSMVDDPEHSRDADIADALGRLRPLSEAAEGGKQQLTPPARAMAAAASDAEASEFPLSERVRGGWAQGRTLLYGVKLDWYACERECGIKPMEVARRLDAVGAVLDSRIALMGAALKEGLPTPPLWYHAIVSSSLEPAEFIKQLDIPCAAVIRLQNDSQRFTRSEQPEAAKPKAPAAATSLRISVPLIDRMMELAGELALVRNQAVRSTEPANTPMRRLMRRLDSVTTELQDAALRMRMQSVGTLFDRFPRLVRDLGRQLGKQIEIQITGSEVELDKTVLDVLADPLTHLCRNACDHGIEMPAEREQRGKPAAGTLRLSARQERGQILIEVRDDGKGLDPEAIKRKALQQGLAKTHDIEALSQRQLFDLIMLSGFSTAARVTDISGRGVGMDVVKTNLEQVGGSVEIDSAVGEGTCFSLRLPLTLAIMPCLLVSSGDGRYAIPQRDIEEIVLIEDGRARIECTQEDEVLRLRGAMVPIVRLSEVLARREAFTVADRAEIIARHHPPKGPPGRQYIAVLRMGSHRFGLVVDNVLESQDIVVKPLHPFLRQLGVFVAATILGDGGISLILGAEGIARHSGLLHRPVPQELPPAAPAALGELQTLLLFRLGPDELLAMPLGKTRRIVQIRRSAIERAGNREMVNVDGGAVNILRLNQFLDISGAGDADNYYLILPRNSRTLGILATAIVDTPTMHLELDEGTYKVDGVLGTTMVNGAIAIVVDIDRLVDIWNGVRDTPRLGQASRRRVLVVEDTQFFQRLIAGHLEGEGFEVTLAGNGEEGLERVANGSFDLITSDIEMPVMDGFEFARRLRAIPAQARVPLLALTTLNNDAARERAKSCGFDAYEVKLDKGAFLATVRSLLERHHALAGSSGPNLLPGGAS